MVKCEVKLLHPFESDRLVNGDPSQLGFTYVFPFGERVCQILHAFNFIQRSTKYFSPTSVGLNCLMWRYPVHLITISSWNWKILQMAIYFFCWLCADLTFWLCPLAGDNFLILLQYLYVFSSLTSLCSSFSRLHSEESLFPNICGLPLLLFFWLKWAGYLAVAGLNLLAQISDRRSPYGV